MKRILSFFLAAVCLLSLAACGSKKPSLEEVEQALQAGTLTLEDAVGKGYVTQEWADEYIESRTVPAADKMEAATKNHSGMIEDLDNCASWCVNGSYLSAWYSTVNAEDLADSAAAFAKMQQEMAEGGENGGIVVMGSMTGSAVGSATE